MEQIFWIKNGELHEVNKWLQKGGRVKMIQAVSEAISSYGYHSSNSSVSCNDNDANHGNYVGDIYAYVVIEFD